MLTTLQPFFNAESARMYSFPEEVLGRVRELLDLVGADYRARRHVVVGGTNGKGSLSHWIAALLQASGLRVGLFTSPHVLHVGERIRVDGRPLSDAEGRELVGAVRARLSGGLALPSGRRPSFFEVLTAMALLHFEANRVDVAVMEVGLGGRLDATNVVSKVATVLGPISLDHRRILGDDELTIAGEKLGIVEAGVPLVVHRQAPAVADRIRSHCAALGAPLWRLGREVDVVVGAESGRWIPRYRAGIDMRPGGGLPGWRGELVAPLPGRCQAENAAVAVAAARLVRGALGLDPALETVRRVGVGDLGLVGRRTLLRGAAAADVLLDGAHNPHAVAALVGDLVEGSGEEAALHLVLGMMADKDLEAVVDALARLGPRLRQVVTTPIDSPRSASAAALAACCRRGLGPDCRVEEAISPIEAFSAAARRAPRGGLIVVTGSFYHVGAIYSQLVQPCPTGP